MSLRLLLPALLLVLPLAGTASAAPTYCSAVPPPDSNVDGVKTSDLTFRTFNSDDCWGISESQNDFIGGPTPDGWSVNTLNLWGAGWEVVLKDDGADGTLLNYLGFDWTISTPNTGTSGEWTLTLTDAPPPGGYVFPVSVDILGVIKTGDNWTAYLFTNETFNALGTNNGTFNFSWTGTGLSHLTLYMRDGSVPDIPTDPVPEPGTMLLLGSGLIGIAAGAKKRFQRK